VTGFTLLELMIAIVVVAILAAIALPNYTESVRKGRRADAIAALQRVQQAQERWRANNTRYASDLADLNVETTSPDRHYTIAINAATAAGYTATATAAPGSPQASDTRCATLQLTQAAGNVTYDSTSGNTCWNR
jgi:type IV pilus assembly protein PilE